MSSTNSGAENRESHGSETPDPFSPCRVVCGCGRQLFSCPGAATDGEPVIIYGDPVRKEDAKIVFVLRDSKYYLAEFWCASDRRLVTAEFDHGGQTTAGQREVQLSYP
jgi:hypothetical protein